MERRLNARDAIFDPTPTAGDDDRIFAPAAYLPSKNSDPATLVEDSDFYDDATSRMTEALDTLDSEIEELQRLRSHIGQLEETLDGATGPIGRKLEFLAQELLREANTMASKSHDTELVGSILALKLCIERIREQVANLE